VVVCPATAIVRRVTALSISTTASPRETHSSDVSTVNEHDMADAEFLVDVGDYPVGLAGRELSGRFDY
jgi:hypothetical protein